MNIIAEESELIFSSFRKIKKEEKEKKNGKQMNKFYPEL